MASWESKSWPLRRWLADRLIGDHAYSRNVSYPTATEVGIWQASHFRARPINGGPAATWEYVGPGINRSPQETA